MRKKIADILELARRQYLEELVPNGGDNLSLVKNYLLRCGEGIKGIHEKGGTGLEVAVLRAIVIDWLIAALFNLAGREFCLKYPKVDQKFAIVALGGYGRRELSPCSDIDIMFLYPWKVGPYIETVIERVLYVLWDTGLDVGYSARNIRDCIKISSDLVAKTSLIDSRLVCGDEELFHEYKKVLREQVLSRNINGFINDKKKEGEERRKKYGDTVYLLEPDVKEGGGGLRDLHTALWAAKVSFNVEDFKALNLKGIINDREYDEINGAYDFMLRIRNDLHFLINRKSDQLTFDLQEKISHNLGYKENGEVLAVEQMMRDYYLTASSIRENSEIIIERSFRKEGNKGTRIFAHRRKLADGFHIFKGEISVLDKNLFIKDPPAIMKLFELSQIHSAPLHAFARDCLRENLDLIDDDFRNSPEVNHSFMNILKGDWDVAETLKTMHKLEVLDRYIPEFGEINCQVQHDLYHVYTVDIHSLFAVEELRRLTLGDFSEEYPIRTYLMEELEKPQVLYFAALLHDIGKGKGGRHEEIGAEMAAKIAARIGFPEEDVEDIKFLVLKHLRLSHTAQRRDIHDPKLILDFAREVGTLERLSMLYLLTYADIKAIGPDVWSEWKSSLFLELYTKTAEVFEKGAFELEETQEKKDRIIAEVKKVLGTEYPPQQAEAFINSMPDRYLFSNTPAVIADHFRVAVKFREPLSFDITHNERRKYTRLIVTTLDSPGLFSKICGVLAANRINILGAQIYSRSGGEVFDIFHVKSPSGDIVADSEKWVKVEKNLLHVIQGTHRVEELVGKLGPSILDRKYRPKIKPRVIINNEISDSNTVIEVHARDKLGLLYQITSTLSRMNLFIDVAKISTMGEQVTDVFYVRDIFGQKIYYENRLRDIESELMNVVEK